MKLNLPEASAMYDYDVVVIGAGSAGLVACKLANGLGKKVALIEKRKIGGDCTWFGCIPSKTLIKSANIAHQMSRLAEFGLKPNGPVELNTDAVMPHVRAVVQADADGHPPASYEAEGINVIFGAAEFLDNHRLKVADKTISAKKFIICTGSRASIPPIEGLDQVRYLTNETIFDLDTLPESMIVLGAGPIGIELSAALNRLGVKVTVLARSTRILKKEDPELSNILLQTLRAEGLTILTETKTIKFSQHEERIVTDIEDSEGARQIEAQSLLVAVGRKPNIDTLSLEKAGVEFDDKGVKVDKYLRTTDKNIYAAGDVAPPYLFTHIAEYEAVIATTNACLPFPIRRTNYENVLWCTYTDPELARAGLTEDQARAQYGDKVRVYRWEHKNVDRAKTDLEENGLTKIICTPKGKIFGIHILGHVAAELMHEVQLAKSLNKPFSKIASVIHAYPSYSDAVRQPAKKCYIDILQNNFFVKLAQGLTAKKNRAKIILILVVIAAFAVLLMTFGDSLTFENLRHKSTELKNYSNQHYAISVAVFVAIYIVSVAFSIPGATVLTLTSGFLYGTILAALYVNVGATIGATLAFIFVRYIAGGWVQKKYSDKLIRFNKELSINGAKYLLTMRFIPAFPFWLINVFAGLTKIPLWTFVWTTSVGILPGSLVYANAGKQIGSLESAADILTPPVYGAFLLLAAFSIFPVVYKKFIKPRLNK
jgi:pyruvate/2-oxoglutarate dehydrogenase complex dihydrolipoamide dehydrogenase (E3) component/uncharacterized membrane protein YdjX (TVP38/TMEM64 family)